MAISSLPTRAANDPQNDVAVRCALCPSAADDASGVRVRVPGKPPPEEDDAETAQAQPLVLPPRPSWIPAPALPTLPRDAARAMRQELATVPDYQPTARKPAPRPTTRAVSPLLWGAVCTVSFLTVFSVGRLLLGM